MSRSDRFWTPPKPPATRRGYGVQKPRSKERGDLANPESLVEHVVS